MKKTNKKLITLLLSGMLGVAALGVGLMKTDVVSAEETATTPTAETYKLVNIFSSSDPSVIGAEKKNADDTAETAKFSLSKGDKVEFRRNLALKWFDKAEGAIKEQAQYFSMKFALKNTNFDELSIVMESESTTANEESKAVNKVTFTKTEGSEDLTVFVNGVEYATKIVATDDMTLTLSETSGAEYGTYNVLLNNTKIGEFTNIGANYAAYTEKKMVPLTIISEKKEGAAAAEDAVVYLYELNNQSFDNIVTEKSGDKDVKMVPDDAAPVIVINDKIADGLLIGTAFAYYSPTVIDVMPSSNSKITKREFYQWNPADTAVTYNTEMKSSHYFMDTTYYLAGGTAYATEEAAKASGQEYTPTTVYKTNLNENGENAEYLSVKYTVQDNSMVDAKTTKVYELAWYAEDSAKEDKNGTDYVYLNKKSEGAYYTYITLDDANRKNVVADQAGFDTAVAKYQAALANVAESSTVSVGSNSSFDFPSLAWFINDNNGYRNLKFVICYKSPSSTSTKSTSLLDYNRIRLSVTEEGYYECKIYAVDAANNSMKYYLDGELVTVNSTNIWDIEEIPTFSYTITRKGVSIKTDSDLASKRTDDVEFNGKYSGFSDPTVIGMSSKKSAYALYKIDTSIYNDKLDANATQLSHSILTSVTYASIKTEIDKRLANQDELNEILKEGDYFSLYLDIYAEKLAISLGINKDHAKFAQTKQDLKDCFVRIDAYDSSITENDLGWDTNKFKWNASSKSFEAVERCEYIIFADYYEKDLATQRIAAYKVIEVEAEEDVNYIKTKWIDNKDNVTSLILFSIAGVMFVMIIILLLVKPSEETLDDVEEEADEKKDKKKNKKKNRK